MKDQQQYFDANKINWNQRVAAHKDSSFYDLAGFKAGKNMLTPIELIEVGDVNGHENKIPMLNSLTSTSHN